MTNENQTAPDYDAISDEVLDELTKRVQDIDNSYRAVAQKMGQLYMRADEHRVVSLTNSLDKPMRNASDNEQMFASILEDLRIIANRRS